MIGLAVNSPQGLDHRRFFLVQIDAASRTTVLEHRLNPFKSSVFNLRFFAGAHLLLETLPALLNLSQIRQTQLQIDHLRIPGGSH